jgi:hypothetical protein
MKLTLTLNDGRTEVFQNVLDAYVVLRQEELKYSEADRVVFSTKIGSHSWGEDIRELVKEVQQSLVELQDFMREQRQATKDAP